MVLATGSVPGITGSVPGPPEGSGGPPGGATGPRGIHGPSVRRDQPLGGLGRLPTKAHAPGEKRGQTLGQMGPKGPCLVRLPFPPTWPPPQMGIGAAATPREGTLGGCAALPLPVYILEGKGQPNTRSSSPVGAALPLFLLLSRGAWRSPAGLARSSTTTTPLCCCWTESSPTSPSLLAGSRHGRRHRAACVLNAEVPSVRH